MTAVSNRTAAFLAAIVTIAASGFAVGAATTSDRDAQPDEQASDTPPTTPTGDSPTSTPVESPTSTPESPSAADVSVSIIKFAFDPPEVTAALGSTVTWTNDDDVTHNVFTSDGLLASPDLELGDQFSFPLEAAGVIEYYCDIHQYMRGTITVAP